jgi:hypothetical protein
MPVIQAEELRRLRRQEPFQPFRIHTKDGEVYEIRDPVNMLAAEYVVLVPVRSDPNDLLGDYSIDVDYDQIARVEMMGPQQTTRNGEER